VATVRCAILGIGEDMTKYERQQEEWVKAVGLEIGDKVKVIAEAEDNANGWNNNWCSRHMVVGRIGTYAGTDPSDGASGIKVAHPRHDPDEVQWHYYPYWCLLKLEDEETNDEN